MPERRLAVTFDSVCNRPSLNVNGVSSLPIPPGESSVFSVSLISDKTLESPSDRFSLKNSWLASLLLS